MKPTYLKGEYKNIMYYVSKPYKNCKDVDFT